MSSDPKKSFPIQADLEQLPDESQERRPNFTLYDVFFWRDAPDWYHKTFLSAGLGFCVFTLRQYLNRHELQVFLPPRAKVLPQEMREGYAQTQRFKYGLLKVGKETTMCAGIGAVYYGGAYYLGKYRGLHDWTNFTVSGGMAGLSLALYMIRPLVPRTVAFGTAFGMLVGSAGAYAVQAAGLPHWDESRGFEGWWLGEYINEKSQQPQETRKELN